MHLHLQGPPKALCWYTVCLILPHLFLIQLELHTMVMHIYRNVALTCRHKTRMHTCTRIPCPTTPTRCRLYLHLYETCVCVCMYAFCTVEVGGNLLGIMHRHLQGPPKSLCWYTVYLILPHLSLIQLELHTMVMHMYMYMYIHKCCYDTRTQD